MLNNLNSRYVAPSVLNQLPNGRDYMPLPMFCQSEASPSASDKPASLPPIGGPTLRPALTPHEETGESSPAGLLRQILRGLLIGSILALIAVLMLAVIALAGALYGWLGVGVTLAGLAGVWFVVWRMAK